MRADLGAASLEWMFSMLTVVEASRCRKRRLPEGTFEKRRSGHRDLCALSPEVRGLSWGAKPP